MATYIRASCSVCGEVDLDPDDIVLRLYPKLMKDDGSYSGTYTFSCPRCSDFVERAADARVVRLLLTGGVIPLLSEVPAEATEVHEGPPLCPDDLLEFHEELEGGLVSSYLDLMAKQ